MLYNHLFITLHSYVINIHFYLLAYDELYESSKNINYIKNLLNRNLSFKNNNNNKLKLFYYIL